MDASALTNAESWLTILNGAKLVAAFLVAIGVAVEFGADYIARPYEKVVRDAKELQLKSLETEALSAKAELAEAKTATASAVTTGEAAKRDAAIALAQVADAHVQAAEANKATEIEHIERLKLEAKIAPRRLNTDQQHALTAMLVKFQGADVSVASYALDTDAAMFGTQLLAIIQNAGLTPVDRRMSEGALGSIAVGVLVSGTNVTLVNELLIALNSFGITASRGEPPPSSGMSLGGQGVPHAAKIFVGAKPLPR
jgi:hypothetical protein